MYLYCGARQQCVCRVRLRLAVSSLLGHADNGTRWPFRTVDANALDITTLHPTLNYSTYWLRVVDIVDAYGGRLDWLHTFIDGVTRYGVSMRDFHGVTTGAWRKVEMVLKNVQNIPVHEREREGMGWRVADCLTHMKGRPVAAWLADELAGYLQRVVSHLVPAALRDEFDV